MNTISVKLSEIISQYYDGGHDYVCNGIRRVISRHFVNYDGRNWSITEQFRKQWFMKVLGSDAYHDGGEIMNDWNFGTKYSFGEYNKSPLKNFEITIARDYRIWVLRKVFEEHGNLTFRFSEDV
jgi:hypothetical protein